MSSYDFDIKDDLQVDETFKEQTSSFVPPLPGNYLVKVNSWDFAKKYGTDTVVLWNNDEGVPTYPLFSLKLVEITDPMEYARKVGVFQDVPTALQFDEERGKVSQAADLLRSINRDATASGTGDVIRQLTDALNAGGEFKARLDYTGYDKEFVDSQFAALGGKDKVDAKAQRKIYASGKVRGYRKILQQNTSRNNPNLPVYKWAGPSGNIIEVKPILTRFYPASDESVRLGPDKAVLG